MYYFPPKVLANVEIPSDNTTGAAQTNRRYARMAISFFAVDPVQVERALRAVQERQGRGENVDFLTALTAAKILSKSQAEHLRLEKAPADQAEEDASRRRPTKFDPAAGAPAGDLTRIGPYRILRRLGAGGMGAVYLGFDGAGNRQVALKILSAEQAPKQNILQRFQREGRHGALLVHPNIVRTFGAAQDAETGLHFIVLEYVEGITALDLLDRAGKLQIGDALHIILDIARALEHAHKSQIIHRDIKPGNILVTPSGLAKLSDLGLAKRRDDPASLTHATQGIGTPYYMPYEQAMNAKMADERSDIYALGATLYHLLTGEVPFPGESSLEIVEKKAVGVFRRASEINTEIPVTLDEILTRMLARDPASRYQTASDVIVDLERSHLAAKIPSFVQIDSALQDPVVVERLTSPVETTQPDLQLQSAAQAKKAREQQIWFLRYRDPRGNLVKAKGSAANVLERIKNGTIPANAEASLSAQGKFKPLGQWPEFQTGLAAATSREPEEKANPAEAWAERSGRGRWLWLAVAAAGIGAVGLVLTTVFLWVWN